MDLNERIKDGDKHEFRKEFLVIEGEFEEVSEERCSIRNDWRGFGVAFASDDHGGFDRSQKPC